MATLLDHADLQKYLPNLTQLDEIMEFLIFQFQVFEKSSIQQE